MNFPIWYHTEAELVEAGAEFRKRVDLPSLTKSPTFTDSFACGSVENELVF